MKSTWIVIGRDCEFGVAHHLEHLYVFESSFDAYAFVNFAKQLDHLPGIASTVAWHVQEHPINTNTRAPLGSFNDFYRIRDVIDQAKSAETEESNDD